MIIDLATLTFRELQIHAAGYLEGTADRDEDVQRADRYLEQDAQQIAQLTQQIAELTTQLQQANDDADRYYRLAFNPRPTHRPIVPLVTREQQRDALYLHNRITTRTGWADTRTRRPVAA